MGTPRHAPHPFAPAFPAPSGLGLVVALLFASPPARPGTAAAPDWAFLPVQPQAIPRVAGGPRLANPVDAFIRAELAARGLEPSPEADRITLIRRLSYDLTGLPPAPEDVAAFAADPAPGAYERLVDRLLASPHHGERWARHWLDVVHFGETHGYDKDKLRPHAWPYRDYVIRAFNEDRPWSQFVAEQLAGDVLFPEEPAGVVALGFIAAGPWDFVGHVELPETKTDGLIARYNDRDDMVMTTFSSFQSLTVHCARCHDHKFDPIRQRDYYALQAVFAGVDRADRPYDPDPAIHRRRRALAAENQALRERQRELEAARDRLASPDIERLTDRLAVVNDRLRLELGGGQDPSPGNGFHSQISDQAGKTKWVQIDLGTSAAPDEIHLIPARPTDFPDTPGFGFPVRFKIELSEDPDFLQARLIADQTGEDYPNPGLRRVVLPAGPDARGRHVRITATRLWKRTGDYVLALAELQVFAGGTNLALGAAVTAFDSIEAGRWGRARLVDGFSSRGRLPPAAPTDAERAEQAAADAERTSLLLALNAARDALVPPSTCAEAARVATRLDEISAQLATLPEPDLVYAAAREFPADGQFKPAPPGLRPVHFLSRGDVLRPGELMAPAGLPALAGPAANFDLPETHPEGERRAALARWLIDPRNLQTRRSIVNRVWQYHFGRGLVDTPNDFGRLGTPPSHPELLDWLAFWFRDDGESLKRLHRLIVTSATYRQSSQPPVTGRGAAEDADNRLLGRMNRTRLDAEGLRDSLLVASGTLDDAMGGPSARQFWFKNDHSPIYDYGRFDVDLPEAFRRSIYRFIVRSVPDPFMDTMDCPDPSILTARRNSTLTPLQALSLLNHPFVTRQAELFAARVAREAEGLPAQVRRAHWLALGREPSSEESAALSDYAGRHGLANACRLLFNSNAFVFVD